MSLDTVRIVSSLNRMRYFGGMEGVLGAKYCSTLAAQYSVFPFLSNEKTNSPGISNKRSQGGGDHCSIELYEKRPPHSQGGWIAEPDNFWGRFDEAPASGVGISTLLSCVRTVPTLYDDRLEGKPSFSEASTWCARFTADRQASSKAVFGRLEGEPR
jgi:hypothetical protein